MATRRPTRRRKRKHANGDLEQELSGLAAQGQFGEIVSICEKELRYRPLSAFGLHLFGVAQAGLEQFESAIKTLKNAAVKSEAEQNVNLSLIIQNDLSKAHFAARHFDEAIKILTFLIDKNPDEIVFARNLVVVLEEADQFDLAIERCHAASKRWPGDAQLAFQLGGLLMTNESWRSAADAFLTVLELDPDHEMARRKLVTAYRRLNDRENVTKTLRNWLQHDPDNSVACHLLAAQESQQTDASAMPSQAPDDYVREVFDQFAETFDEQLAALGYAGPELTKSLLADLGIPPDGSLSILDAGCGTGLMGEHLRPFASRLVGVDLSSAMLDRAADRGYDALICSELVAYLTDHADEFDLILSMDTLIYFGDLTRVFHAANHTLCRVDAPLLFSLEKLDATDSTIGYHLNPSGRYSHDVRYVRETLEQCGFSDIRVTESLLRKEAGKEVTGLYWSARKCDSI